MSQENQKYNSDFRVQTTFGVAITSLVLLSPFSISQFHQGHTILGIGSLIIIVIFAINAWSCKRGNYNPILTFTALVPAIILFLVYAFHKVGVISIFWCYPAVLGFYFMLPERLAWVANIIFLAIIFPHAWDALEFSLAIRLFVSLVMVSMFSAIFVRVISNQQKQLEAQAQIDPLTGLFNRTLLQQTLESAIEQCRYLDSPMTLMALDLDNFKLINDTMGHSAGDKILSDIGKHLQKRARDCDKVFRIGGEEFLVVLHDSDKDGSVQLAEELRLSFSLLKALPENKITVSIGIATLQADENWDDWMKRCDRNMYRAKEEGRDCVVA